MGDYSDPAEVEAIWRTCKRLIDDGLSGWWLDAVEYCDVGQNDSPDTSTTPKPRQVYARVPRRARQRLGADAGQGLLRKARRDFPDQSVYILNRTVFPGVQACATDVNQGDYWSSWKLMRTRTVRPLQIQMSGVMFPEGDIGGHRRPSN
jgi:alpha-glucosidase (family GH31 glycosyl hydrolase)